MSMNRREFFEACSKFDWLYAFSDDGRVYRNGKARESFLQNEMANNIEFKKIYDDFHKYAYSKINSEIVEKPKFEDYE